MNTQATQDLAPEGDPFHVGDRIRKARERTGMNRQEFAEEIGIHRETLGKYEDKGGKVKRPVLSSVALLCSVRMEWLETGQLPWTNETPHPHNEDGECIEPPAGLEPATCGLQGRPSAPVTDMFTWKAA